MRLTIGLSLSPTWLRGQAWRRDDSRVEQLYSGEMFVRAARLAEQADLDFLFKPDGLAISGDSVASGPGFSAPDPVVLLSALARETSRIGLIPTISSTFAHPYTVARQLQSLDQLSRGRAGWNLVTSLGGAESHGDIRAPADLYANAADFLGVVEGLRQSFPGSALRMDRASGVFADAAGLTRVAPRGRYSSSGPLTIPALSPHPLPLLHAGGSPEAEGFAATHADGFFAMSDTLAHGVRLRERMRELAPHRPHPAKVLPGLALHLADSHSEAERTAASAMSQAPSHVRHWSVIGTPQDAVDDILRRAESGAIDGFIALPAGSWRSVELFLNEVVPALAAQGLFRARHEGMDDPAFTQEGRQRWMNR